MSAKVSAEEVRELLEGKQKPVRIRHQEESEIKQGAVLEQTPTKNYIFIFRDGKDIYHLTIQPSDFKIQCSSEVPEVPKIVFSAGKLMPIPRGTHITNPTTDKPEENYNQDLHIEYYGILEKLW